MYLVAIAWLYVVVMMTIAEAMADNGTLLGAAITFVLYGALPLGIALYLLGTPMRRRARRREEALAAASAAPGVGPDPDRGGHPPGDAVAPVGKEP